MHSDLRIECIVECRPWKWIVEEAAACKKIQGCGRLVPTLTTDLGISDLIIASLVSASDSLCTGRCAARLGWCTWPLQGASGIWGTALVPKEGLLPPAAGLLPLLAAASATTEAASAATAPSVDFRFDRRVSAKPTEAIPRTTLPQHQPHTTFGTLQELRHGCYAPTCESGPLSGGAASPPSALPEFGIFAKTREKPHKLLHCQQKRNLSKSLIEALGKHQKVRGATGRKRRRGRRRNHERALGS